MDVLLVEADVDHARILRTSLHDLEDHCHIHHVERIADALESLDERAFDVVLLDLHEPDGPGVEALHRLLEVTGETPVIVLTGSTNADLGLEAIEVGAQDHLVKGSLGPEAAMRAIRQAIRRQQVHAQLRERVKELTALYATTRALQRESEPAAVAEQVAEHLVAGFERPASTWAVITIDGASGAQNRPSPGAEAGIDQPVLAGGVERGRIRIGSADRAPFLDEERVLVTAVAESLGLWLARRDAVEERRRTEQRVRVTLAQLPVALTSIDHDLNITTAEGGAFDLLGIHPAEMIGPIADHRPTETWVSAARRALRGRSVSVETRWRSRHLLHHLEPLTDEHGDVEAAVCISLDVTESRERDAELVDQRDRLQALFDHARDAIFLFESDGRILDANPAACELVGRPRDELIGAFNWVLTEDPDTYRDEALQRSFLDAGEMAGELRVRRADGSIVETEYRAVTDIVPGVHLSIVRDITARKTAEAALTASEERYRTIAEGMRDVVYRLRLHPERHLEYVNPVVEEVTGFPPEDFLDDPGLFRSRCHAEDVARITDEDLEEGEVRADVLRFRHADDRWIWLEFRRSGLFEDGELVGIQGFIHDVSDRERASETRERAAGALRTALENERRAMEDLRALEALKTSFLQSVSHELRTPLTAMIGASRLLAHHADDLDREKVRDLQTRLERNAGRVEQLLRDLLDVDTLGRVNVQGGARRTDLVALARSVVDQVVVDSHTCEVVGDDVVLPVDAPKVRRMMDKLLENAVKHTPDGTSITVRIGADDEGIHLVVEDDGPGVPPELRSAIFEAFRQGPDALADPSPGTGLGLAIVARLAELADGRAWVDEPPGGGARFHVHLPHRTATERIARPRQGAVAAALEARGVHEVVFDDSGPGRIDRAAHHISRAIALGGLAVAFLTVEQRDGLVEALAAVGSNVAALVDDGHLIVADATATAERITVHGAVDLDLVRAQIGGILERARSGNRRVEVFSELGAVLLRDVGIGAALDLEQHWNDLGRIHPHGLLCSYPARRIQDDADTHGVRHLCEHHTRVVPTVDHARLRSSSDGLSRS